MGVPPHLTYHEKAADPSLLGNHRLVLQSGGFRESAGLSGRFDSCCAAGRVRRGWRCARRRVWRVSGVFVFQDGIEFLSLIRRAGEEGAGGFGTADAELDFKLAGKGGNAVGRISPTLWASRTGSPGLPDSEETLWAFEFRENRDGSFRVDPRHACL